jgi:hypothetical protein
MDLQRVFNMDILLQEKETVQNATGINKLNRLLLVGVIFSNTEGTVFFRHNINKYRSVSTTSGCQSVAYKNSV